MMNKRVTMQDIADACGLSRNTVSKVFNQRGAVPQATKDLILQTAQTLGYGLPVSEASPVAPAPAPVQPARGRSIALFTSRMPANYHFGTFFFPSFSDQVCRAGYNMKMYEISPDELQQKKLPPHFHPEDTAGIIGIELFDAAYLDMVCQLGIPTLFIDSPASAIDRLYPCDFVTMENMAGIITIMEHILAQGVKHIGFVGDIDHCGSFFERWVGYSIAMTRAGLPIDQSQCILAPDDSPYGDSDWLMQQLDRMSSLPGAFICANDFLALHLIGALKKMGLSIPQDVMVAGFDGIPQMAMVEPQLTTVIIPSAEIGRIAADVLLRRIRMPESPFTWTRVKATPVLRGSTGRIG